MTEMHNPPHPGEILQEEFAEISVTEAAKCLGISRVSLSRVLNGASGISAQMDLRLSKALGTTPGIWLGMQMGYDLWQAKQTFKAKIKPIRFKSSLRTKALA